MLCRKFPYFLGKRIKIVKFVVVIYFIGPHSGTLSGYAFLAFKVTLDRSGEYMKCWRLHPFGCVKGKYYMCHAISLVPQILIFTN